MNADLTSDGRGDFSDQRSSYNLGRSAMPQLQIIILSERRKMIMSLSLTMSMKMMTVYEDGNGDGDEDGDDEIEKVWSCMLCVLGRPLS